MDAIKEACRKCDLMGVDPDALLAVIDDYVATIPEDQKVSHAVYENRLARCFDCDRQLAFTCISCGCYVQARAVKRRLRCPEGKWAEG